MGRPPRESVPPKLVEDSVVRHFPQVGVPRAVVHQVQRSVTSRLSRRRWCGGSGIGCIRGPTSQPHTLLSLGQRFSNQQGGHEAIFRLRSSPLLLPAVNLNIAPDPFGHGDRSRGVAVGGAVFVLRTPCRNGVCTHGDGYRESTVGTDSNAGKVPARPVEGHLSAQGSRLRQEDHLLPGAFRSGSPSDLAVLWAMNSWLTPRKQP